MKIKVLFILLALVIGKSLFSQHKGISIDLGLGYRSNISTAGFGLGFCYGEKVELHVSPSFHFIYAASGFTIGLKYNLMSYRKVFPSTQVSYRHLFSAKQLSVGYNNDRSIVTYSVQKSDAIIPQIGFNWRMSEESGAVKQAILAFNLNYLISLNAVKANYVNGTQSEKIEQIINNRYQSGLGFSLTYSVYF